MAGQLPPGFVLDAPIAGPKKAAGGLPPGFVLDGAPAKTAAPRPSQGPQTVNSEGKGDKVTLETKNRAGAAGLADMLSFGFADEIAGGIETAVRKVQGDKRPASEIYTGFRDQVRQGMAADAEAAPSDYLGGQVLGGAASFGIGSGFKAATGLLPKVWQGAKSGAKFGAAYGFGSGDGFQDSLVEAGKGALTGAAVGGAVPVALAPIAAAGKVAKQIMPGKKSAERFATEKIAQIAEREGKSVAQVQAELQRLQKTNPEAIVMDALGEGGGRLGRAVVNRGGKGSRELSEGVYNRQIGQNDRITGQLSKSLGDPESYQATLDTAIETLRKNAGPLYEKAYKVPINYEKHGPAVTMAWSRVPERLKGQVVAAANDLLVAEGKQAKAIGAVIGRRPDGKITPLPTVEQWDYIKRGLDAVIGAENTKGAAGGISAIGRSLNNVKNDLLKVIDGAVPEFKAARMTYSDDLSVKNALELGRKSLNSDADLIAKTMKGLDNASRDTYRVGYARAIAEQINNMGPGADAIGRIWAAPNRQRRLIEVFGDEATFRKFADFAAGEAKMRKSYNALSGNSTTARQISDMTDSGVAGLEPMLTAGSQLVRGDIMGAALTGLRKVIQTTQGMTERRADEIAKILASPSIPQGTVNRAGQYQMSREQRATLARVLRDTASRGAVAGVTGQ